MPVAVAETPAVRDVAAVAVAATSARADEAASAVYSVLAEASAATRATGARLIRARVPGLVRDLARELRILRERVAHVGVETRSAGHVATQFSPSSLARTVCSPIPGREPAEQGGRGGR